MDESSRTPATVDVAAADATDGPVAGHLPISQLPVRQPGDVSHLAIPGVPAGHGIVDLRQRERPRLEILLLMALAVRRVAVGFASEGRERARVEAAG